MGFELTLPLPFWAPVDLSMPGTALEHDMNRCIHARMNPIDKTRRVTANLPITLLKNACQVSGAGITETLVQGLTLVKRAGAVSKAARLRGRLKLDIDLEASRERARR